MHKFTHIWHQKRTAAEFDAGTPLPFGRRIFEGGGEAHGRLVLWVFGWWVECSNSLGLKCLLHPHSWFAFPATRKLQCDERGSFTFEICGMCAVLVEKWQHSALKLLLTLKLKLSLDFYWYQSLETKELKAEIDLKNLGLCFINRTCSTMLLHRNYLPKHLSGDAWCFTINQCTEIWFFSFPTSALKLNFSQKDQQTSPCFSALAEPIRP